MYLMYMYLHVHVCNDILKSFVRTDLYTFLCTADNPV